MQAPRPTWLKNWIKKHNFYTFLVPSLPFLVYFSPFGPKPILSHTQIACPFFVVEKLRHWDALAGSEPLRNFWQAAGVIIQGEFLHIGILKVQRHHYFYTGWFFIGPESHHCLPLSLTDWLTHSLTDSCLVNFIDVTLACEDANSKLVTVADDDRVGNNSLQIWKLRFGQKA